MPLHYTVGFQLLQRLKQAELSGGETGTCQNRDSRVPRGKRHHFAEKIRQSKEMLVQAERKEIQVSARRRTRITIQYEGLGEIKIRQKEKVYLQREDRKYVMWERARGKQEQDGVSRCSGPAAAPAGQPEPAPPVAPEDSARPRQTVTGWGHSCCRYATPKRVYFPDLHVLPFAALGLKPCKRHKPHL